MLDPQPKQLGWSCQMRHSKAFPATPTHTDAKYRVVVVRSCDKAAKDTYIYLVSDGSLQHLPQNDPGAPDIELEVIAVLVHDFWRSIFPCAWGLGQAT